MNQLYCDGGVCTVNPSPIGGTWAFLIIKDGLVTKRKSGVVTPSEMDIATISNNLTEMLALINGLEALPPDWTGTVFSDSQVTLGRVFMGWKWNNIPQCMHKRYQAAVKRLIYWPSITHILLDGHPTNAQLEAGRGKRGHLVSIHNVWCDLACREAAALLK